MVHDKQHHTYTHTILNRKSPRKVYVGVGITHTREGGALTGGAPKTEGVRQDKKQSRLKRNNEHCGAEPH